MLNLHFFFSCLNIVREIDLWRLKTESNTIIAVFIASFKGKSCTAKQRITHGVHGRSRFYWAPLMSRKQIDLEHRKSGLHKFIPTFDIIIKILKSPLLESFILTLVLICSRFNRSMFHGS